MPRVRDRHVDGVHVRIVDQRAVVRVSYTDGEAVAE
jgi:hypothetical protein